MSFYRKSGFNVGDLRARMRLHRRRTFRKKAGMKIMRPVKMNYFITKIRANFAEQGNNVTGQPLSASFLLNYPTYFRNTAGVVAQMQLISNHYVRAFNLFDEYKVIGLRVQLRNAYSQVPIISGSQYILPTTNAYYPLVYSAYDDDSDENLVSISSCLTGTNVRRKNFMTGKSVTRKAHPRGKIDKAMWFNTGIPNPNAVPDNPQTLTYQMPKRSSLKFFLENCPNATIGWDIFAEWTVMFKGLNLSQLNDLQDIDLDHQGQTGVGLTGSYEDPVYN